MSVTAVPLRPIAKGSLSRLWIGVGAVALAAAGLAWAGQQGVASSPAAFMAHNGGEPGVITTESGLQYKVIKEGQGPSPKVSDVTLVSYQGTLIDEIAVTFRDGAIVEAKAKRGEAVLKKVLDTDDGARRLGEVALVPHSSPISASGILFYNTLFDENAASHIALGQCYSKCFVNGAQLTPQQIAAQGGNQSLIHIDWMIGSAETDIDGILPDGSKVPVFRKGEWAK